MQPPATVPTHPAPEAEYLSKTFDPRTASAYRLVLCLGPEAAKFALLSDLFEILVFRAYANTAQLPPADFASAVCYGDSLLQTRFATVDILAQFPHWSLAPAQFVPMGAEAAFLAAEYDLGAAAFSIHRDNVRTVGGVCLYALPEPLTQQLGNIYQQFNLRHACTPMFIEVQRLHYALRSPYSVGLHVLGSRVQVFVTGLFGLLLANEYPLESADAAVAYADAAMAAAGVPADEAKVYTLGRAAQREAVDAALQARFPGHTSVRAFYAAQAGLNQAGFYHDQFPHLLQRLS